MPHFVLLGDSIFDNAAYVPGRPAVTEQVRAALPAGWQASLLAVDGDVVADISHQLQRLPDDATHLAISAGGNDALGYSAILNQPANSVSEVISALAEIQTEFRHEYHEMLAAVVARCLPTLVCTIYDAIPGLPPNAACALGLFNDVILREAIAAGTAVLDLRLLCDHASDYSSLSPIEPSVLGGAKIAAALARIIPLHDFARRESVIYGAF